MNGFAIIKLEADPIALQENIVQQFNDYMQRTSCETASSFILGNEGYFRVSYDSSRGISSAGIFELGNFLVSSGRVVSGISGIAAKNGSTATEFSFSTSDGKTGSIRLSTERIY